MCSPLPPIREWISSRWLFLGFWRPPRSLAIRHVIYTFCSLHVHVLPLSLPISYRNNSKVVGSQQWPLISRYRASMRTQSPKVEMIGSLFKPVSGVDEGIVRDGVSESQFNQVLSIELDQIIEACKFLDEKWCLKFTVTVAQKNHQTKSFQKGSPDNVPPGTVIDKEICHPRNNGFYMCSYAGMIGTTRPTHYNILFVEIGFTADELVHSLSYVYQRSTTAISNVLPICYAHLAAAPMGQLMKSYEMTETCLGHGGVASAAIGQVLHQTVSSCMFFC